MGQSEDCPERFASCFFALLFLVLVVVHRHMEFLQCLIKVFDGRRAVSAEIAVGVILKIMPRSLDFLDRLTNDGMPFMLLRRWLRLWSCRNKHRSGQHPRQEHSPERLYDIFA